MGKEVQKEILGKSKKLVERERSRERKNTGNEIVEERKEKKIGHRKYFLLFKRKLGSIVVGSIGRIGTFIFSR